MVSLGRSPCLCHFPFRGVRLAGSERKLTHPAGDVSLVCEPQASAARIPLPLAAPQGGGFAAARATRTSPNLTISPSHHSPVYAGRQANEGTAMNLSLTLQTIAKVWPDRPAIVWDGGVLDYRGFEAQVQRIAGALAAGTRCARRSRGPRHGELPRVSAPALRHLARRALRRADEQQAARQGDGVDHRRFRSPAVPRQRQARRRASPRPIWAPCRRSSPWARPTIAHCSRASLEPARPATPGTRPGCSTPVAPPVARRAPCSRTATCCSPATATTPTSTRSVRRTPSCTPRRSPTAPASTASPTSPAARAT